MPGLKLGLGLGLGANSSPVQGVGAWLLITGFWRDAGVWSDTAIWRD